MLIKAFAIVVVNCLERRVWHCVFSTIWDTAQPLELCSSVLYFLHLLAMDSYSL
jgi:hypothetical protein